MPLISNIELLYPYVLLGIIPFIISSLYFKAKSPTYYFPHLNLLAQSDKKSRIFLIILKWVTIALALLALASPVRTLSSNPIQNDGIDIVLALDTSGSMRAIGFNKDDLEQNRWQAVQGIVKSFIQKRVNDNIGLIVFGSSVLTASPISFDKEAQSEILDYIDIAIAGDKTALIDSIASSVAMIKNSKAKSKIIILLTDGVDTASNIPLKVINKVAKKNKVKIYAIGIGEANRALLDIITKNNNGKTFIATSKEDLNKVYEEINKLEKTKLDNNKIILRDHLFFYPLFFAILGLILLIYLKNKE